MGPIIPLILLMLLLTALLAVAAHLLTRRTSRDIVVILAGLTVAAMLIYATYLSESIFIASVIPPSILPVFGNLLPPLAGILAGFAWTISSWHRLPKTILLGSFILTAMYFPYQPLFAQRPPVKNLWYRGVCLQTTNATCGPAAAATLLATLNISTTEQEMANLCFSTARGTTLNGLLYGLSVKLQGTPWQARPASLTAEQLRSQPHPAIIFAGIDESEDAAAMQLDMQWGWIPGVIHATVYVRPSYPLHVAIADPATGPERWSLAALSRLWRGKTILIEPRR